MKIAVAGAGYVGLSIACLLAQNHDVNVVDVVSEKVDSLNKGMSPIADNEIQRFLIDNPGRLHATCDAETAYAEADYIVVATPTDYDDEKSCFDTETVEAVLATAAGQESSACIVIRSTVPVGYTKVVADRYPDMQILFSPEFLREGKALHDNYYPSRIVVGLPRENDALCGKAHEFASLLLEGAKGDSIPVRVVGSTEAEAIKLFANTYLAMRISYFNELDTYAASEGLNTAQIIEGVSLDPRIGEHYNNPSFGYGGYCLPKDSKQLLANFKGVPQTLIKAVVEANRTRKDFIAEQVVEKNPKLVGMFRLIMKEGSDNIRHSSAQGVMRRLLQRDIKVLIYEPTLRTEEYFGCEVTQDLTSFKQRCDLILSNRHSDDLADVADKLYTRDLWQRD